MILELVYRVCQRSDDLALVMKNGNLLDLCPKRALRSYRQVDVETITSKKTGQSLRFGGHISRI